MSGFETEEEWQAARDRTSEILGRIHGSIVGNFVVNKATSNGDHPEAVSASWQSVLLPVREKFTPTGEGPIKVVAIDAFNSLVEVNTDETVLQYWLDILQRGGGNEYTTFGFDRRDGEYLPLLPLGD
ncbi:MAG TPA: hypothetical protein VFT49_04190 [Candidatus Saccharimonadales bacterium]|nr:hypothetical protein [Candidatus Saccharimonadales bacterium]